MEQGEINKDSSGEAFQKEAEEKLKDMKENSEIVERTVMNAAMERIIK